MSATTSSSRELLFIDSRVRNLQELIDGANPGQTVFVLDAGSDGVQQIADIVATNNFDDVGAIHIVSHGAQGQVQLGTTLLNDGALTEHAGALADIGAALAPDGDLLLYGCDVAAGDAGMQFIADLSTFTGADVAASTDLTGAAAQGGDWALEASTGTIEASSAFTADAQADFQGVLANETFAVTQNSVEFSGDGDGVIDPGETVTTTVQITNNSNGAGAQNATGVQFVETLGTGVNFVAGTLNVSPLAFNDSYDTVGNTELRVGLANTDAPAVELTGSLFANDKEFNNDLGTLDTFTLKAVGAATFTGTPLTVSTALGGTVTVNGDGSFSYTPQAGDSGADSFTYTITDDGIDGIAGNADDLTGIGTVTINISATQVWYVDDSAPGGGTGTSTNPYNSLAAVSGGSGGDGTGDTIYLFEGNYSGGITLLDTQTLHGAGSALTVAGFGTIAPAAGTDPIITNAAGSGITVEQDNTITGVTVANTTGYDIANTAGQSVGTLNVNNVVLNGNGGLVNADTGGTLAVTLESASTTGTAAGVHGINLANTTGNFTVNGSGTLSGVDGTVVRITGNDVGDDVNFTLNGSINDDVGQLVLISDQTGGTKDFNGQVTDGNDGDGSGISLQSNAAANLTRFDGGLTLSTGANNAFVASSGGTLAIVDPGGAGVGNDNTITTTTGTALNVAFTDIHADDLNFRSISVNGAANGIVLNTTGGAGNLNVTGTDGGDAGTAADAGTGGTISNTTGDGVSLTNASNVALGGVNISNTGGQGINMTGGSNLTLTTVSNTGAGNGDNEHGLKLFNVSGTVSIQGSTFADATEDLINIDSNNGSDLTLNVGTVTASTFTQGATLGDLNTFSGNGILVTGRGTSDYTINVEDSTFNNIKLFGVQVGGDGTWASTNTNVNLDNNDFLVTHDNEPGDLNNRANAINIQGRNTVDIDASITNNLLDGGGGGGIQIGADQSSNINANITGNTVSDQFADGILIGVDENASLTVLIDDNDLSNTSSDGMELSNGISPGGTSTLNATITNNTVAGHNNNDGNNSFVAGIAVFGGVEAGDVTNLDIRNNSVTGNPNPNVFFDYYTQGFGDTILVEGIGTAAVTEAAFLAPGNGTNNLNNTSNAGGDGQTFLADAFFNNNVNVPLPVLTPLLAASGGVDAAGPDASGAGDNPPPSATGDEPPAEQPGGSAPAHPVIVDDGLLSQAELDWFVDAAVARWSATGLTAAQVEALHAVAFTVEAMDGQHLGSFAPGHITLDTDAAGIGWFLDGTPLDNVEFANVTSTRLVTGPAGAPADHFDLLTAVMHEMGHALGLGDSYEADARDGLMYGWLFTGERRLPGEGEADGAVAGSITETEFLNPPTVVVGDLEPGKTVTIQWRATVDPQTDQVVVNPTNTGTVSATNADPAFPNVVSNETLVLDDLTLGSHIFKDLNTDGNFDAGEGVSGVALTLWTDGASVGFDGDETQVATTTTGADGVYSFTGTTGLAPGNYILQINESNFGSGQPLAGFRQSVPGADDPDDNDDTDENGFRITGQGHVTLPITLAYNTEVVNGLGNDTNNTLDIGVLSSAPTITNVNGDAVTFLENGAPLLLDDGGNAVVGDPDSTHLNGGNLTVTISAGHVAAEDRLSIVSGGNLITVAGSNVSYDGDLIGTVAGGNGAPLVITFTTTDATPAAITALAKQIAYQNINLTTPNTGARTVGFAVNDGDGGTSATSNVTVSVTAVNDAPSVTSGDTLSYTENQAATVISTNASVSDPDSGDFNGGSLTVAFTANGAAQDQLSIITDATVTVVAGTVSVGGLAVGTVAGGANGAALVVSFNTANATPAAVTTLMKHIGYANNSEFPSAAARTVTFTVVDGDGNLNGGDPDGAATATINITSVNDQPQFADLNGTPTFTEDGAAIPLDSNATLSDFELDAGNSYAGATLTLVRSTGTNPDDVFSDDNGTLSFGATEVSIGGSQVGTYTHVNGTLVITFDSNATSAHVDSVLQQLTYRNDSDNPPASVTINYAFSDGNGGTQGGTFIPGTASGSVVVGITPDNDAPTLDLDDDDSSTATGSDFQNQYIPAGAAVAVADGDTIVGDVDDTNIESATITITNAKANDLLSVSGLPAGIAVDGASTATNLILTGSASKADYETALEQVRFSNTGAAPDTETRLIDITVNDGNDLSSAAQASIFLNDPPTVPVDDDAAGNSVTEGAIDGTEIGIDVSSTDPDTPITYSLTTNPSGFFEIDSDGVVTVSAAGAAGIDFETATSHSITVRATDAAGAFSEQGFTINVNNVNPTQPVDADAAANTIAEGAANGTAVAGFDADASDPNGPSVAFTLTDNAGGRFAINGTTGVVTVADGTLLNFESATSHQITVQAADGSGGTSSQNFTINVSNVNPTQPVDADAAANTIAEGAANGTAVAGFDADASDPNGPPVTFSLTNTAGGRFTINASTGVVTVANGSLLDFESATSHDITVQASDGTVGGTSSDDFTIDVTNVNDAPANTVPGAQSALRNQDKVIAGLAVNDADAASGSITTTLKVDNGTLTVASAGGAAVGGSGTDTVTLTGTLAQINTTLAAANNVIYRGDLNYIGGDVLTMTTDDGGNTGPGGPLSDIDTVAITVQPNDLSNDFNGDANGDILWRNVDGTTRLFLMDAATVLVDGNISQQANNSWVIQDKNDFNGDGNADILWRNANNGMVNLYEMDGTTVGLNGNVRQVHQNWKIQDTADFNGDGNADILWRSTGGMVNIYLMDGRSVIFDGNVQQVHPNWKVQATGDFGDDGKDDILWRDTNGTINIYEMDGLTVVWSGNVQNVSNTLQVQDVADFNGDGKDDILWRNTADGTASIFTMDGRTVSSSGNLSQNLSNDWQFQDTGDYDGDGNADILWRHTDGTAQVFLMDQTTVLSATNISQQLDNSWLVV